MPTPYIKDRAIDIVKNLPDDAGWDDLMYKIYVIQRVEEGLADSENDRVLETSDIRKKFALDEG